MKNKTVAIIATAIILLILLFLCLRACNKQKHQQTEHENRDVFIERYECEHDSFAHVEEQNTQQMSSDSIELKPQQVIRNNNAHAENQKRKHEVEKHIERENVQKTLEEESSDSIYTQIHSIEIEMVYVQGGIFIMGCDTSKYSAYFDHSHQVTLSSFYIGKYPVTQGQWVTVMGSNPSHFKKGDSYPVESVTWDDTQIFIRRLNELTGKNYRLPTESEWEYAARGGNRSKGYAFSGSNNIDEVAWYNRNSDINNKGKSTQPVGKKLPNELGIYDMSGNVNEWCNDWLHFYTRDAKVNPQGPSSPDPRIGSRVLRGGNYFFPYYIYLWFRYSSNTGFPRSTIGFRLAHSSDVETNL